MDIGFIGLLKMNNINGLYLIVVQNICKCVLIS